VALFTWLPTSPTPGPTFHHGKASLSISTGRSLRYYAAFARSENRVACDVSFTSRVLSRIVASL